MHSMLTTGHECGGGLVWSRENVPPSSDKECSSDEKGMSIHGVVIYLLLYICGILLNIKTLTFQ